MKFQKGQSGNPKGRTPHGPTTSLTAELRAHLRAHPHAGPEIIRALVKQGMGGNVKAIQEMFDRIDGPVDRRMQVDVMPVRLIFQPAFQADVKQLPHDEPPVLEAEYQQLPDQTTEAEAEVETPDEE